MMEIAPETFDATLGDRIRRFRTGQALTLDDLSGRSGVSRAMISRIERGEASPTAQLLARLCSALGTTLSRFFAAEDHAAPPLSRAADQRVWRDPETGYLRRSVSPDNTGSSIDIVEVDFPPGGRVVFDPHPLESRLTQHVWIFEGRMTMTVGTDTYRLEAGDCLFMPLGGGHVFHNPHDERARYAVVLNRSPA